MTLSAIQGYFTAAMFNINTYIKQYIRNFTRLSSLTRFIQIISNIFIKISY